MNRPVDGISTTGVRAKRGRGSGTILRQTRKLLSIMRPMLIAGELHNEELVCNECGAGGIGKVGHLD
jgi:hypothetical protein